jgi:hypothetical protein
MEEVKFPKYGRFVHAEDSLADQLRFLAVAVSGDETRYFMADIEVEEMEPATDGKARLLRAIATDGRRMHIVEPLNTAAAEIHGMEPGRWHVVANRVKYVELAKIEYPDGSFPNWRKVVPDAAPKFETEFFGLSLKSSYIMRHTPDLLKLFRSFPEPTVINLKYLEDLGTGKKWKVEWHAPDRAVVFASGECRAIIMPMQAD